VPEQLISSVTSGDVQQTLDLHDADVALVSDGGPDRYAKRSGRR
jgi:hypothetical protein